MPAGDFRYGKISSGPSGFGGYLCIKTDFDSMESLALAREGAARYKRRMGPEVVFEVE